MSDQSPVEVYLALSHLGLRAVEGRLYAKHVPDAAERVLIDRHRAALTDLAAMVVEVVDLPADPTEHGPDRLRFVPFWCECGEVFVASDKDVKRRCPMCGRSKATRLVTLPRRAKRPNTYPKGEV